MRNARVGSTPNKRLRLNCDITVLSPALDEYTIHRAKGVVRGMVAANAAKSLLCFSKTATRMMTAIERRTGRMS